MMHDLAGRPESQWRPKLVVLRRAEPEELVGAEVDGAETAFSSRAGQRAQVGDRLAHFGDDDFLAGCGRRRPVATAGVLAA
jgi:hypothetical protein